MKFNKDTQLVELPLMPKRGFFLGYYEAENGEVFGIFRHLRNPEQDKYGEEYIVATFDRNGKCTNAGGYPLNEAWSLFFQILSDHGVKCGQ